MIVGITGSLSCGKTTVSKLFSKFGFKIINADKLVHGLLNSNTRRALRKIVINNPAQFRKLEKLVHPRVIKEIRQEIIQARRSNLNLIIDAPLLIECGLSKFVDFLIVVKASQIIQLRRAKLSLSLTKQEALKLIKRQMPLKDKAKRADFIINNNGNLADTKKQVKNVWEKIKMNKGGE